LCRDLAYAKSLQKLGITHPIAAVIEITHHNDLSKQLQSYSQIAQSPRDTPMPKAKDTVTWNKAKGLLESHWRPQEVAKKLYIHETTAYRWEQRMQMFNGQIDCPEHLQMVSKSFSSRWLFY
jgi:hypothetical protein